MRKKIVLLCRNLYFELPCIKYSKACGWKYYMDVLGVYIDPVETEKSAPKWVKPWIWNLSDKLSYILFNYLVRNKEILKEDYYSNREQE